jgi:hypothetical protein
VLGVLVLLGVSSAAAQIGGQTGTIPGFPQFYESSTDKDCEGGLSCDLGFGLVPQSSLFMATDITCRAFADDDAPPGTRARFVLREVKAGEETVKNEMLVADVSPPSTVVRREYLLHETLVSFFTPGSRPNVRFVLSGGTQRTLDIACKLAGNLIRQQ